MTKNGTIGLPPTNHKQINPFGYIPPKDKDAKIFENHLNLVVLVFIG